MNKILERKHIIAIIAGCVLLVVILFIGFGLANSGNAPLSAQTLHLKINGHNLEIPLSADGASYDAETMNIEFPNTFELMSSTKGLSVSVNDQKMRKGNPVDVAVDKIAYDENIPVTVSDGKNSRTVYIRTLNSKIPTYTANGESPIDGDYYLSLLSLPVILKLDNKGEIVYYLCANDYMDTAVDMNVAMTDPDSLATIMSLWDFKKHTLPNGEIRYSYHEQDPTYNRLNMFGYAGGTRVIMDEKYIVTDRIKMETDESSSINVVEGHDFYLIDDDHYIVSNYELKLVHNIPAKLKPQPQGSKVIASHLQEVKGGKVLLDWYSTDHADLYALSEEPYNDFANMKSQQPDYAHFNSIDIDPEDDNLICSFRNLSTILKIDRKTGDIIWKLSGKADQFGLTDHQKTSNQHYVRCGENGYITIFDNNVRNQKTRILKLKIDQQKKSLSDWKEFIVPGHFSVVCGSAVNPENETFAIGWGGDVTNLASLTEIDFSTGKKFFELTFPPGMNFTYRCAKYK